jgi:hypothetical protein
MGNKRTKTLWWILIIVTVVTFLGGFVFLVGVGLDTSLSARSRGDLGTINGARITRTDFASALGEQRQAFLQQTGSDPDAEESRALETQAWRGLVTQQLLNAEARRGVNQVKVMLLHKSRLDEARRLRDALERGAAAGILREIDDASVYYGEAQEELIKLLEAKPTLKLTADNLLRQKDCKGAIATLKELQLIDPKDSEVTDKLDAAHALVGTKKCVNSAADPPICGVGPPRLCGDP